MDKVRGDDKKPLLVEETSERGPNDTLTVIDQERSLTHCKATGWQAPSIILGFECLESLGLYGICTNLVIYLSSVLHESNTSVATSITNWTGTSFLTPFVGALIADSYWGNYKMIFFSSLIYFIGMLIMTLSASLPSLKPPSCKENICPSATEFQKVIFYSGLYLIAFGSGGVKSSLLPLGADQFNDEDPLEREKRCSFFNWFYFCNNVGAFISGTLIVWIQEKISWSVGYGFATLSLALAILCFIYGNRTFRKKEPRASFWKYNSRCLQENEDTDYKEASRLTLAHEFRPLGKTESANIPDTKEDTCQSWKNLCSEPQLNDMRMLLNLFPIWVTSIIYSVAYAQMDTTFVVQGKSMNTIVGSFYIPPASFAAFEVLSIMLWVFLYDKVIIFYMKELTQLQRMGMGHFLMIIVMFIAGIVEVMRLKGVKSGEPLSILWQIPQYFVIAASEVLCYIGQLEFFYEQGPNSMRSVSTSISLLTISLGNYLSSLVVTVVDVVTSRGGRTGWISDNLEEGHLDYFFWLLGVLCVVNFMCYIACAQRYAVKKVNFGLLNC